MTDILTWSINLGRWSGVQIRVHYFLIFFAVGRLLNAAISPQQAVAPTACWLLVLLLVLALHELGHASMAMVQNVEPDDIRLWPLGNFVVPSGSQRPSDSIAVASAGPITSGLLALASAIVLGMAGARMVVNPFGDGNDGGGVRGAGEAAALRGSGMKWKEPGAAAVLSPRCLTYTTDR